MKEEHRVAKMTHRDALGWIIDKHLEHEVNAFGLQVWEDARQLLGVPAGELVPVAQFAQPRPDILGGSS